MSSLDLTFLKDLEPYVAIILIFGLFSCIALSFVLIFIYKRKKEENIHKERMEEIKNQSRLINKLLLLYRLPNNPDGNIFSFKQEAAETTIQQSIIDALTSEKRTKEKKRNRNR